MNILFYVENYLLVKLIYFFKLQNRLNRANSQNTIGVTPLYYIFS